MFILLPYLVRWEKLSRVWEANEGCCDELLRDEMFRVAWDPPPILSNVPTELRGSTATLRIAETIEAERDFDRLPILADALEEAGVRETAILDHCRQGAGLHEEQCWVVDMILERDWLVSYEPPGWTSTAHKYSDKYDTGRAQLATKDRRRYDRFFQAFFWWNKEVHGAYPLYEIELTNKRGGEPFVIAMRPSTVRKYVRMAESLRLDELRAPFETLDWGHENVRMDGKDVERPITFDDFRQYVMQWVDLVRYAQFRGRGIAVTITQ